MTDTKIVGHGEIDPRKLVANPKNWRKHPPSQEAVLGDVLDEVGWVQSVIVNKTSGRLVDGHLRVKLAAKRGDKTIPVSYVELTEEEEDLVLATLDPLAGMARADKKALSQLVEGIDTERAALRALIDSEKVGRGRVDAPTHRISAELLEAHNYVVLYFDSQLDWQVAMDVLGIEPVEALDSREGYRRAGIGRVMPGAEVVHEIQEARENGDATVEDRPGANRA